MHETDKLPPSIALPLNETPSGTGERGFQPTVNCNLFHGAIGGQRAADRLRMMVLESLAERRSLRPRLQINQIERSYQQLERSAPGGVPIDELLSLKYLLCGWRRSIGDFLLGRAEEANNTQFLWATDQLAQLRWILRKDTVLRLKSAYGRLATAHRDVRESLVRLLHSHGDPDYVRSWLIDLGLAASKQSLGPAPFGRRIRPYAATRFKKLDHWLSEPEVAIDNYCIEDADTISIRGMHIKTGDVILADLALPHEGLLNSYVRPRSHYTHSGMVLVLRYQGRRIPLVLEMHERGARFVPLNRFLSPTHTYYGEIFRCVPNPPPGWQERLSRNAMNLVFEDQISYDFLARPVHVIDTLPPGERCATCYTLIDLMFLRTGVYTPPRSLSRIPENVVENTLRVLGLENVSREFPNTTEMVRSGAMLVGVFDNDALPNNLGRELVVGHIDAPGTLAHYVGIRRLRTRNVQDFEWWFSRLVGYSQENTVAGHMLRSVKGHTLATIPTSATPAAVAFYLAANRRVGPLVQDFCESADFMALLEEQPSCHLGSLQTDWRLLGHIQNLVQKHHVDSWF